MQGKKIGELEGRVLGRWQLRGCLGRGGMSVVHEAIHLDSNERAAIKVLLFEGEVPEEIIDRFYFEVHILRRLKHPNIVEVYEFGFDESVGFYLAMEFLSGCSLYDYMLANSGDLPDGEVYTIVSQICDAMEYAHQREIVHRDLKPENVFLVGGPERLTELKVLDFGIAKFQLGESSRLTQSGTTLGTPHYLSPEQARGEVVGPGSDIYSLSVMLFELLTGAQLFTADSPLQYMMCHAYNAPPTLSEKCPHKAFPRALEELVKKGLEKQPEERHQSMAKLKKLLHEAVIGVAIDKATSEVSAFRPDPATFGSYRVESTAPRSDNATPIRPIQIGGQKPPETKSTTPVVSSPKQETKPTIKSRSQDALPASKSRALVAEKQKQEEQDEKPSKSLAPKPRTTTPTSGMALLKNPVVLTVVLVSFVLLSVAISYSIIRAAHRVSPEMEARSKRSWLALSQLPTGRPLPSKRPIPRLRPAPAVVDAGEQGAGGDGGAPDEPAPERKKPSNKWMKLIKRKLVVPRKSEGDGDVPDAQFRRNPPVRRDKSTPKRPKPNRRND